MKKRKVIFITLIGVVICVCSVAFFTVFKTQAQFDKEDWLLNPERRFSMVDDLKKQYQLIGMTEKEIENLLGPPSEILEYDIRVFEYYISSGIVDPITLDIYFQNGIVVDFGEVNH